MGEKTGIEWTDKTWNTWQGCRKVSPGCTHCYMFTEKIRYGQDPRRVVRSKTTFTDPLGWRDPGMVFTCSWSDFFIEEADPWRDEAWGIIRRTPHLTYQILTKRPENIPSRLPWRDAPWPHVWLGVSIESADYTWRAHLLREVPAHVRFLSVEPLLEPIPALPLDGIHWVIVGAESGPKARPMDEGWVRDIRDQCVAAGVPFFYKQNAIRGRKISTPALDGQRWTEFPVPAGRAPFLPGLTP